MTSLKDFLHGEAARLREEEVSRISGEIAGS